MSPSAVTVPLGQALRFWLKLGFISFGGPAGQIALMHTELVERRRWISEQRFLHALNYCMLLPGPEAQQLATYLGWLMHRTWGGVAAGTLFVLPSFFVLVALSWIYLRYGSVPAVAGFLYGIKPAVTAIVLFAACRIGSRTLHDAWLWAIAVAAFVAIFAFDVPFPAIVIAGGLAGWIGGRVAPARFARTASARAADAANAPALIDDATPPPPHARFSWPRLALVVAVFVALWATAFALLAAHSTPDATLARMAAFFTRAALLTFGGAYGMLPYVLQGAVEKHGWLTADQMIDGLALGETTPGPLIMIVAFVGFVGGWTRDVLAAGMLFWSGVAGAAVATFFTFLPSFLFILAGGPLVESTHGDVRFTAPLTGITAAIVGVIVDLAAFFAWHVFWPQGFAGGLDGLSLAIALAAFVALYRFRVGVVPVIVAAGTCGLLVRLLF
jgi:chromate transporter